MGVLKRGLLFLASAGIVAVPAVIPSTSPVSFVGSRTPITSPAKPGAGLYEPNQIEYYLDDAATTYVRPGLVVTILSVANVAPSQKPVVEFTIADDLKQPLDLYGGTTPGVVSMRFVVATWDDATRTYTNLLVAANGNPTRDTAGKIDTVSTGRYKFTFSIVLPNFDTAKAATMFAGGVRNLTDIVGKNYYSNVFFDFVPATGATPASIWAQTSTAKCNACHNPIAPHGGNYREIKACMMCHNPNNMTGAAIGQYNGQVFFHQIHTSLSSLGPITYPQDVRNCANCHDAAAKNGDSWAKNPAKAACGSCHNTIDWTTGANHTGGPAPDDAQCASCHQEKGTQEFDASVRGAHVVPYKSTQLKGIAAEFVKVENGLAGQKPTVTIKVTNGDKSAVDPNTLARVRFQTGYPSIEYSAFPALSETAETKLVYDAATGTAKYTFGNAIPSDVKDYTIALDVRRSVLLKRGDGKADVPVNEVPMNPIFYGNTTVGVTPTTRRVVVAVAKCNACHDRLALHGGRVNTQECSICHNPNGIDRRTAPDPNESIDFKRMIHRIHMGEKLTQEYTISTANYNEVTFPGEQRDCIKCHSSVNTYNLNPIPAKNAVNTLTARDYFTPMGPGTTACLGCHDAKDQASHALINTAPFGEACGSCHGAGSEWSPAKVHAF